MIYLALLLTLPALWFFSWWLIIPISFGAGYFAPQMSNIMFAFGVGGAWACLAFLKAERFGAIITERLSILFGLPHPALIYLLVFTVGFVTACLWFNLGKISKSSIRKPL